jgi:hypothetical protein
MTEVHPTSLPGCSGSSYQCLTEGAQERADGHRRLFEDCHGVRHLKIRPLHLHLPRVNAEPPYPIRLRPIAANHPLEMEITPPLLLAGFLRLFTS